jgi:hypothetical protein
VSGTSTSRAAPGDAPWSLLCESWGCTRRRTRFSTARAVRHQATPRFSARRSTGVSSEHRPGDELGLLLGTASTSGKPERVWAAPGDALVQRPAESWGRTRRRTRFSASVESWVRTQATHHSVLGEAPRRARVDGRRLCRPGACTERTVANQERAGPHQLNAPVHCSAAGAASGDAPSALGEFRPGTYSCWVPLSVELSTVGEHGDATGTAAPWLVQATSLGRTRYGALEHRQSWGCIMTHSAPSARSAELVRHRQTHSVRAVEKHSVSARSTARARLGTAAKTAGPAQSGTRDELGYPGDALVARPAESWVRHLKATHLVWCSKAPGVEPEHG